MLSLREDLVKVQPIPYLHTKHTEVFVLRLDKIHPLISGNKWYKLRNYLSDAFANNKKRIVTFGGAYSNHLLATAAACKEVSLACVGIIRGEKPPHPSATLNDLESLGMELYFMPRSQYKEKILPAGFLKADDYMIPEGGYGQPGADGAASLPFIDGDFDSICCACGTGTMLAGLANAHPGKKINGYVVLKNYLDLAADIRKLLHQPSQPFSIHHDYHFNGYARYNQELIHFINDLYMHTNIPTDFVYTGKLFYGVAEQLRMGYFDDVKKLLVIHSGGLQGNRSLPKGTLIF